MSAAELTIGSFNIHAGVDGWGRLFDAVEAAKQIDTDVLILPEAWGALGEEPLAQRIAQACGYTCFDAAYFPARMLIREETHPVASPAGWGPPLLAIRPPRSMRFVAETEPPHSSAMRHEPGYRHVKGLWGLSVLTRLPVVRHEVIELPRLRLDRSERRAIALDVSVDGRVVRVVGTHLAHLEDGSFRQMRYLHRRLGQSEFPVALGGDMNSWSLPLLAMFPGWRRAVKGRTWPSSRPHSQIDHILVKGPVEVLSGEVLEDFGSDHLPIRTRLRV